ncbi:MAG: hypothetical protein IJ060_09315 [Oscillospiraceae bacterium]|nr:hypothetical protein [Oscillospiraceae bacterium]
MADNRILLDGAVLPVPLEEGLSITANHIWSSNAGRNATTGDFVGDIIAVKHTVVLNFPRLTGEQMQMLWSIQSGTTPWHRLEYPFQGGRSTIICYITDIPYTLKHIDPKTGRAEYLGVTMELIER